MPRLKIKIEYYDTLNNETFEKREFNYNSEQISADYYNKLVEMIKSETSTYKVPRDMTDGE